MFLFIKDKEKPLWQVCLFKYISCSYLSNEFPYGGFWVDRFKYISCSYLSHVEIVANSEQQDLNTSHVLIYRNSVFLSLNCPSDLNTSHVLIYQNKLRTGQPIKRFKYISCSYLSNVFTHFLFSIISYIALFFNISQLFYQPPPHFSFSSSLVSFPLIL